MPALLTVRDVADRLQVSRATVLRWTRQGMLPGFRLPSGAMRYREDELAEWLAERTTDSRGQTLARAVDCAHASGSAGPD